MTLWLLGNQLRHDAAPLAHADSVLLIESHEFPERLPYHPFKLTLVFSAMRHFRDRLREDGYDVTYIQCESFGDGLEQYFEAAPEDDADSFRQEHWYRHVRRETGILMSDGDPIGGDWNYDDSNQETPPDDWSAPPIPEFQPDEITREVHEFVTERYDHLWGNDDLDDFVWPVTRAQALQALDQFVEVRLPAFGPYQDAMVGDEWALDHSLLSPAINLGLLTPEEVVERVESAYAENGVG
ncbi:MAG: cryptochrome/photolyase family protein, partial [Halobaculum sp.]